LSPFSWIYAERGRKEEKKKGRERGEGKKRRREFIREPVVGIAFASRRHEGSTKWRKGGAGMYCQFNRPW